MGGGGLWALVSSCQRPSVVGEGRREGRGARVGLLLAHGAGEAVDALEAGVSLEADVVPGAGAVGVVLEEVLDAAEVLVDAEVKVAGPSPVEARGVGWEAALEVVDVVLELVEEVAACGVEPVRGGAGAAEGVEEVLEEVEGGVCGLLCVVGVQEGVREGARRVLVRAGLRGAGSHVAEELEAVPGEGAVVEAQGAAGEGVGGRREEEQERQGAVDGCWWWGCGPRHGGCWVALGRSLLGLGGGAGGGSARGAAVCRALCGAASLFPFVAFWLVRVSGCGFQFWWLWCVGKCVVGVALSVVRVLEVLGWCFLLRWWVICP